MVDPREFPSRRYHLRRLVAHMADSIPRHLRARGPEMPGLLRRVGEQWALLWLNGIESSDYYALRLYRREMPWSEKREYAGKNGGPIWLRAVNPFRYSELSDDKLRFKQAMTAAGLPVARTLGVVGPGGSAADGRPLPHADALAAWLDERGIEHVVMKPSRGIKGVGVISLGARTAAGEWERCPAGRITLPEIREHARRYADRGALLVEERLEPHPALARYAARVLHTARVVTMLDETVEVIGAALRIGMGTHPVDNLARGNLVAPIDLETGRLGPAVSPALGRPQRAHPVTAAPIEGEVVPDWQGALALVRQAARALPVSPCLGWDVALTSRGPVIQEANDIWDPNVLQLAHGRGILTSALRRHLERSGAMWLIGFHLSRPAREAESQPAPSGGATEGAPREPRSRPRERT